MKSRPRRKPARTGSVGRGSGRGNLAAVSVRPVETVASRIAHNQRQLETLNAREVKLMAELDKVTDEQAKLVKEHAELLREMDRASALPRFDS